MTASPTTTVKVGCSICFVG